jgi:hypothetical protein
MEKDIKKIIREYDYCKEGAGWAAQEIDTLTKAHYFEFVGWKDSSLNCQCFGKDQYVPLKYNGVLTLDEVYNYWITNYKKK